MKRSGGYQEGTEQGRKVSGNDSSEGKGLRPRRTAWQGKTGKLGAKKDADLVSPSAEGAKKGDRVTWRLFSLSAFC